MRRLLLLLALLLSTAPAAGLDMLVGGIQVNEPDHDAWMEALRREGLNTVAVTVYARQGEWDSDDLWFEASEPGVLAEIRAARRHGIRVVLVLRVALEDAFERNEFLWHGMIRPRTEEQLASWFSRYRRFAVLWAGIARDEGVELLGIGSELNSMTSTRPVGAIPALEEWFLNREKQEEERERVLAHESEIEGQDLWVRGREPYDSLGSYLEAKEAANREWARASACIGTEDPVAAINHRRSLLLAHWREVIRAVRAAYSGSLTYAANFDQYREVGFWPEVDVMGINAYFSLRSPGGTGSLYDQLREGWRGVLDDLEAYRRARGLAEQPVLFTELGYTWRQNSTLEPWQGFGFSVLPEGENASRLLVWTEQREGLEERAAAVRALHDELVARSGRWFRGLLWWKLSTDPGHRDIEPFVLVLDPRVDDPLLPEIRRFTRPWWRAEKR